MSVTNLDNDEPADRLYFSLLNSATVGGVSAANEDILAQDVNGNFRKLFDGSDVGLSALTLDAFDVISANQILLSFTAATNIPGAGTVDDSDLVLFTASSLGETTAGSFSLYFDGSDVGLTTDNEDIDSVERLADGRLVFSTLGSASVTGASGQGEDLLVFTPTSLGATTAGTWSVYFDGSDVGLTTSNENIDAMAVDGAGKIYLSTTGNFAVSGVSGANEDVFVFTPTALGGATSGNYSPSLFFDGSPWGLSGNDLSGVDVPQSTLAPIAVRTPIAAPVLHQLAPVTLRSDTIPVRNRDTLRGHDQAIPWYLLERKYERTSRAPGRILDVDETAWESFEPDAESNYEALDVAFESVFVEISDFSETARCG